MNQTEMNRNRRKYHIHIDATFISDDLYAYATNILGLIPADFSGHPQGYRHFAPRRHLTAKINSIPEFNKIWDDLEQKASETGFIGYIEGEWVKSDVEIPFKPYTGSQVPFQIVRRRLLPEESFRQTELHLVMDKDASHPKLIKDFLDAGLYGAYMHKKGYTAIVLTAQGFVRDIDTLVQKIQHYLVVSGGAVRCTLKEERAIRHSLFKIQSPELPEIIDKISYTA